MSHFHLFPDQNKISLHNEHNIFLMLFSITWFQKCELCASLGRSRPSFTICVQCSVEGCVRSFHVTCGLAAGSRFQADNRPGHIYVNCVRHASVANTKSQGKQRKSTIRRSEDLFDLNVGDLVLAKHKVTRRYYWTKVIHVLRKRRFEVDFDDGSFSDDLLPEDIMVRHI